MGHIVTDGMADVLELEEVIHHSQFSWAIDVLVDDIRCDLWSVKYDQLEARLSLLVQGEG